MINLKIKEKVRNGIFISHLTPQDICHGNLLNDVLYSIEGFGFSASLSRLNASLTQSNKSYFNQDWCSKGVKAGGRH